MIRLALRRKIASCFFSMLPLIVSQRLRALIYTEKHGILESVTFVRKSITGSLFTGHTRDMHAAKFAVHGFYDWRSVAVAKALRDIPGDILELGANIGTETVCFSDLVGKGGTVFAFEPFVGNLNWLHQNAKLSKNQNVKVFPFAISDTTNILSFKPPRSENATGTGSICTETELASGLVCIEVPCYRLDDLIDEFNHIKAIFIDIEGADFLAILGGQKLITRDRPLIVLEVSPKLMTRFVITPRDIRSKLAELGYKVFNIGKMRLTGVDLLQKRHSNWICLPEELLSLKSGINRSLFLTAIVPPLLQRKNQ